MSETSLLTQIRDLLNSLLVSESSKGRPTTQDIVEAFIRRYPDLVAEASIEFTRIALTKFVSDVSRRHTTPSFLPEHPDLFAELSELPGVVALRDMDESGRKVHRHAALLSLTLSEAHEKLNHHTSSRSRAEMERAQLQALVERVEPYMTDGMTLGEGLVAAREAEEPSAEEGT